MQDFGQRKSTTKSIDLAALCFGGDGESRTRVQRKHSSAFYMLSSHLNCREATRTGNPPVTSLPAEFRWGSTSLPFASLIWFLMCVMRGPIKRKPCANLLEVSAGISHTMER